MSAMRPLSLILIAALVMPAPGQAQTGAAQAIDQMMTQKCNKPDSKLIKPGTTDSYNAQAKGFNDCLRIYVENENNKIARITAEATAQFDSITTGSNGQIRDIERAINNAILEVGIVNGTVSSLAERLPGDALTGFPAPVCARPDEALLKPARGKRVPSLAATDRYEAQRASYEACVRRYIAQAKGEIAQISANAQISFRQIADDANGRIGPINDAVSQALADARTASGERDVAVNSIRSDFGPAGHSLDGVPGLGMADLPQFQHDKSGGAAAAQGTATPPGTESVTVTDQRLHRSADMPTGEGDPDAISCRTPQQLPGSRLMGPEICKHNRKWAKLYKRGEDISPDGGKIVMGEKQRTFNPQSCVTNFSPAHPELAVTTCGTPGGQ